MEIVDYEDVQFCPECGSSDVKFEVAPMAALEVKSEVKSEVMPETKSEIKPEPSSRRVYTWTQREPSQKRSGYSSGMSEGAKIRVGLGIIGLIMVLSALGMFMSGMSGGFSGGFTGIIVLAVIGVIFLAIATKGEICDC
jgi:hypothetical protein